MYVYFVVCFQVQQAGSNNVFSADAYVLFYGRIKSNNSSGPSTSSNTANHMKNPSSPVKVGVCVCMCMDIWRE